jgi:hypothetical protein
MRKLVSILIMFLTLFVSIDYVLAQGLLIKTRNQGECTKFCNEMVFNCNAGTWTKGQGWCLLWQNSKPPTIKSSLAVYMPSETECDGLEKRLGGQFWWKKDDIGLSGWCIEGKPPVSKFKPDLSKAWKSNQSYGDIHWVQGWYGNKTKTITINKQYWDNSEKKYVVEGKWARTTGLSNGGFKFFFDSPNNFSGKWWYSTAPTTKNVWGGESK